MSPKYILFKKISTRGETHITVKRSESSSSYRRFKIFCLVFLFLKLVSLFCRRIEKEENQTEREIGFAQQKKKKKRRERG